MKYNNKIINYAIWKYIMYYLFKFVLLLIDFIYEEKTMFNIFYQT